MFRPVGVASRHFDPAGQRILRYLRGATLQRIPESRANALFAPHRRTGSVVTETAYPHLERSRAPGRCRSSRSSTAMRRPHPSDRHTAAQAAGSIRADGTLCVRQRAKRRRASRLKRGRTGFPPPGPTAFVVSRQPYVGTPECWKPRYRNRRLNPLRNPSPACRPFVRPTSRPSRHRRNLPTSRHRRSIDWGRASAP